MYVSFLWSCGKLVRKTEKCDLFYDSWWFRDIRLSSDVIFEMFADMMASSSLASVIKLAAEAVANNYGDVLSRTKKYFLPKQMPQPHSIRCQVNYN